METAAIGGTREGRHLPADAHRPGPPGARLVQGARREARLHGHHRRHGRDVRAPRRHGGRAADRVRQPSRHPADRRQVRRRAGRARRAGGAAHAGRGRLRDLRADRGGELDQRGGLALCACDGVVGRVRRRDREGLGGVAHGPRRRDVCRGARSRSAIAARKRCGAHPLSAFFELHIEQGPILEAEGKDIGVVTGVQAMRWYEVTITGQDAHTGATPMQLAQERAARRGADGRCGGRDRQAASARRRHRRPDREPAELAQRGAGRGVLHDRPAPSGRRGAQLDGIRRSRSAAAGLRSARADVCRAAHLGAAGGAVRCGLRRRGPPRGGAVRIFRARHRVGRRPRRGLCVAGRAGRDGVRAVPRRHQPQRGGVLLQGAMRQGRAGAAAGGARLRPPARRAWQARRAASGAVRLPRRAVCRRVPRRLERQHQAHARSARHHDLDRDRRRRRVAAGGAVRGLAGGCLVAVADRLDRRSTCFISPD